MLGFSVPQKDFLGDFIVFIGKHMPINNHAKCERNLWEIIAVSFIEKSWMERN